MNTAERRKRLPLRMTSQDAIDLSLRRLNRLVSLEIEYSYRLNEKGIRLIRRSTYSVYCDCVNLGLTNRAKDILGRLTASEGVREEALSGTF